MTAPNDEQNDKKNELFWTLAEPLLARPQVTRGTMMGFPCLRVDGGFFASLDHKNADLIVKLPRERVMNLIEDGDGLPFAPAGRTFREWIRVPTPDADAWRALMAESMTFVAGS